MGPPTSNTEASACRGCVERDRRIAELEARNAPLEKRVGELERRIEQLTALLEGTQRAGKRQAAPFAKGSPKASPKKPGRKRGDDYGTKAYRATPPLEQIDETHDAPLPDRCPHCGAAESDLHTTHIAEQYQVELPLRPIHRRFRVHVGRCGCCSKRVQGRHGLQTSDALGAAASQLGPHAQAATVYLNKHAGLSHGKIADVFKKLLGVTLSRGGACQAMQRAGRRCEGEYQKLIERVNQSRTVVADETGWRIGGLSAWLHVMVGDAATVYGIDRQRGFEASCKLLSPDFSGVLVHDGWRPYERFTQATHQTCLGHLLRRCQELLEIATRGAVVFPRRIKALLKQIVAVRHQWQASRITTKTARMKADALERELAQRVRPIKTHAGNERLAAHLQRVLEQLTTCLRQPGVDATNHRAEQAIRPGVVNRKVWGGNRTHRGAQAQSTLMSILATCRQRGFDEITWLSNHLRGHAQPLAP